MLVPLGPAYKLDAQIDSGIQFDLLPFGSYPFPIWSHEHREKKVGLEAMAQKYLYAFIDNPYHGRAQSFRENTCPGTSYEGAQKFSKRGPPPPPQRGESLENLGEILPQTLPKRGGVGQFPTANPTI